MISYQTSTLPGQRAIVSFRSTNSVRNRELTHQNRCNNSTTDNNTRQDWKHDDELVTSCLPPAGACREVVTDS